MTKSQQQKRYWTRPSLIIFVCLITTTLIVPTLIVAPFSHPNALETKLQKPSNISDQKAQAATTQTANSSLNINVYRSSKNIIETVPLEEYVVGVVASEMPTTFELEALKAQSLAARTFLFYRLLSDFNDSLPDNADISDNLEMHQVYKNKDELAKQWGSKYETNISKIQKAVSATKGQILTYNGQPIDPLFFSTSNGYTENSEDYWSNSYPYLQSVESSWDKASPKFESRKVLKIENVEKALDIKLNPASKNNIGEIKLTKSKRVDTIRMGNKEFSGVQVRTALDLPSNDFKIQQKDGNLIFTTRGNGHGVGMSQYGANGMAQEGKTYEDIVKYYYRGVEIASHDFVKELIVNK